MGTGKLPEIVSGGPLRAAGGTVLSLFYPDSCQLCGSMATAAQGYVCPNCWHEAQFVVPPCCERCGMPFSGDISVKFECANCLDRRWYFERAMAAARAKGVVRDAIHRLKYSNHRWMATFLGDLLVHAMNDWRDLSAFDLLVPVPLHAVRLREREFNQAEDIARAVARGTQLRLESGAVSRLRDTLTQTALSRKERIANMRGAFDVRKPGKIKGRAVIIIDDVFTTGATTNACARAVRRAGASRVVVWTVARGI